MASLYLGRGAAFSALLFLAAAAHAYNPPVDTAGPLTAAIQDPALGNYGAGGLVELTRPGLTMAVDVALTNSAGEALAGSLRLGLIDGWQSEPGVRDFRVPPKGRAEVRFQVTVARKLYNADYPIHAYADFSYEGQHYTAHPVLIMEGKLPDPPRAELPVEWKAVPVPPAGVVGLLRLPVHRQTGAVTSARAIVAANEVFQSAPLVEFDVTARRGKSRQALAMRLGARGPSFRERIEAAAVEYPLALPDSRPLQLTFLASAEPASAAFRVSVAGFSGTEAGDVVFERTIGGAGWHPASVDLSRFAGKRIRLRLEARGESDTEADWAEPAVVAGTAPTPEPFPPASTAGSRVLGRTSGGYEVRVWPGRRGLLDAAFELSAGAKRLYFHGFQARVIGDELSGWNSASQLLETREEGSNGHYRVRHRFRSWAGDFDLLAEAGISGPALQVRFRLENTPAAKPWLDFHVQRINAGEWSEALARVYLGPGNVIEKPSAFHMGFGGHELATSFAGYEFENGVSVFQGLDVPPLGIEVDPGSRKCSLTAADSPTFSIIPTEDVWKTAARDWPGMNGMKPAGGVSKLAGRFVFDLWSFGASYRGSTEALRRAFRYGLTDAAVVWHNWQRWRYDYRLPDVYPPNPEGGTLEDFAGLAALCRRNGVLFAPHDNYIDFYPDAEGFSYDKIAFQPDGAPKKAWFRAEFKAQSYRFRPDSIQPFVERNLRLIAANIHPTAYFIDVWASMGPYDYWTPDGLYMNGLHTREIWGKTFAWIRDFLGDDTPQISEAGHDQLTGWLDGAQAQVLRVDAANTAGFTWRIACRDAERTPWFDAAHHDRFALHGAGYPDRYAGGLDEAAHGIYSNDYIATEVLTGHPAMVADPFGRDVVRKYWLLHDLMRALALRRMEGVEFADRNIHRQHVRWQGGDAWVNRGESDWTVEGHTLPQYGFYARVASGSGVVEAAIERRDGRVVEWATSPTAVYRDGFRLTPGGVVRPLPDSGKLTARIEAGSLPWSMKAPQAAEALDEDGKVLRQAPVENRNGVAILECEPGVFAWRLSSEVKQ